MLTADTSPLLQGGSCHTTRLVQLLDGDLLGAGAHPLRKSKTKQAANPETGAHCGEEYPVKQSEHNTAAVAPCA